METILYLAKQSLETQEQAKLVWKKELNELFFLK